MRIIKPEWIQHKGSIESIAVSPNGLRIATGGIDGAVRIWDLEPVLDPQVESSDRPRLLARFNEHFAAVSAVRFTPRGNVLVTASLDKQIFLYALEQGGAAFGSQNIEPWQARGLIQSHGHDVLDLAVSPDSSMVAFVDIRGSLNIWDISRIDTPRLVQHKEGSQGSVKGVAWDPLNRYVATEGLHEVNIWSTDDWSLVRTIADPLRSSVEVFVSRLDWSPDGMYLAIPNAVKSSFFTCVMVDRAQWQQRAEFVGHVKPVIVARWNPCMVYAAGSADPTLCCALGSYDTSVSVWLSNQPRPVVVVRELFTQYITDAAWTPDGRAVAFASADGSVAVLQFEASELGARLQAPSLGAAAAHDDLVEDPLLLGLQKAAPVPTASQQSSLVPARTVHVLQPRSKGDRRRIAPVPVSVPGAATSSAPPRPAPPPPPPLPPPPPPSSPPLLPASQTQAGATQEPLSSAELRFVPPKVSPRAQHAAPPPPAAPVPLLPRVAPAAGPEPPAPAAEAPSLTVSAAAAAAADRREEREKEPVPQAKRRKQRADGVAAGVSGAAASGAASAAGTGSAPGAAPGAAGPGPEATAPRALLPPLLARATHSVPVVVDGELLGEVRAATGRPGQAAAASLVEGLEDGRPVWTAVVPAPVVRLLANRQHVVALCEGGRMCVLQGRTGRLALPQLVLEAAVSLAALQADGLAAVALTDGTVYLWDLPAQCLLLRSSAAGLVRLDAPLTDLQLIGRTPVLCRADGAVFGYSAPLGTWVVLIEAVVGSEFMHVRADVGRTPGPLSGLMARLPAPTVLPVTGMDGRAGASATLLHLESQVLAARLLQSANEQRQWTLTYARMLATTSDERRLRVLFAELYGTPSHPGDRALLRTAVEEVARITHGQVGPVSRVTMEYLDILGGAMD